MLEIVGLEVTTEGVVRAAVLQYTLGESSAGCVVQGGAGAGNKQLITVYCITCFDVTRGVSFVHYDFNELTIRPTPPGHVAVTYTWG